MKSAYELAMERLEKQTPSKTLTPAQVQQIAEITSVTRAKIAEKELFLREQIQTAKDAGDFEGAVQIEQQLLRETARLREEAELKKEKIRQS